MVDRASSRPTRPTAALVGGRSARCPRRRRARAPPDGRAAWPKRTLPARTCAGAQGPQTEGPRDGSPPASSLLSGDVVRRCCQAMLSGEAVDDHWTLGRPGAFRSDVVGALEVAQRRLEQLRGVRVQGQQRLARRAPGRRAWRAARCPRPPAPGPPCGCARPRAARRRPRPPARPAAPGRRRPAPARCTSRATFGSGASGSPPWAAIIRRQRPSRDRRRARRAGSTSSRPAPASISRARASVSSTTSRGPPPASTSSDSATSMALPAVSPSGVDMSVSRATVCTPGVRTRDRPSSGRARGRSSSVFMKAPEPTLTSSTRTPVPSAIFLLMIELAISGIASTVPVTSRRHTAFGPPGPDPNLAAQITAPTSRNWACISSLVTFARQPGDRLQLVQRAAGVPQPAAGQLRHRHPAGRHQRRQRQRDLVADPAGRMLVGRRAAQPGEVQPLPRGDHRRRPAGDLTAGHPVEQTSPSPAPTSARRPPLHGCRRRPPSRSAASGSSPRSRLRVITSTAANGSVRTLADSFTSKYYGPSTRHPDSAGQ